MWLRLKGYKLVTFGADDGDFILKLFYIVSEVNDS
jgi:hypothetical protein